MKACQCLEFLCDCHMSLTDSVHMLIYLHGGCAEKWRRADS
jgi:hypothetical protein